MISPLQPATHVSDLAFEFRVVTPKNTIRTLPLGQSLPWASLKMGQILPTFPWSSQLLAFRAWPFLNLKPNGLARVIDDALLKMLRCPNDLSPLSLAKPQLLEQLNQAIVAKQIVNLKGDRVEQPLKNALFSNSSELLYPIVNHIPAMLPGEAISLNQLDPFTPKD